MTNSISVFFIIFFFPDKKKEHSGDKNYSLCERMHIIKRILGRDIVLYILFYTQVEGTDIPIYDDRRMYRV